MRLPLLAKVVLASLLALITAPKGDAGPRTNLVITIVAGTPIQVAVNKTLANEVLIQPQAGGSGIVYVMADILPRGRVPATSNTGDVAAQLCASTSATVPGCAYSDPIVAQAGNDVFVDMSLIWIDGSHTGDKVTVSYTARI